MYIYKRCCLSQLKTRTCRTCMATSMAKIAVNEDWGEPTGDSKSDLSINNVEYIRVIFCFV